MIKSKLIILLLVFSSFKNYKSKEITPEVRRVADVEKTSAIRVYECIEKYSDSFNIPKHIIYNIIWKETRYKGPNHVSYKGNIISKGGAIGAMQLMPRTARGIIGKKTSKETLRDNLELNIGTSARLIHKLYDKHKNWVLVCGEYNTGKVVSNKYARYCANNKDYKKNWIRNFNI